MNGNDFMSWVLRSPFHGMLSSGMMLITVTGRKTGKTYTTPVEYYEENGYLWVVSSRDRTWWRNLKGGAGVGLVLKRRQVQGFAETEMDEKVIATQLASYLRHAPMAAKPMGIRMENNAPNPDDLARVAKDRLFVRIKKL